ncbi:MAG: phage integrase N-terminal SAM-like domain-containing protein [Candidatus Hodarchaeota archaeon]
MSINRTTRINRFILFHNKRPDEIGASEVNVYLTHTVIKENVAASIERRSTCAKKAKLKKFLLLNFVFLFIFQ